MLRAPAAIIRASAFIARPERATVRRRGSRCGVAGPLAMHQKRTMAATSLHVCSTLIQARSERGQPAAGEWESRSVGGSTPNLAKRSGIWMNPDDVRPATPLQSGRQKAAIQRAGRAPTP